MGELSGDESGEVSGKTCMEVSRRLWRLAWEGDFRGEDQRPPAMFKQYVRGFLVAEDE